MTSNGVWARQRLWAEQCPLHDACGADSPEENSPGRLPAPLCPSLLLLVSGPSITLCSAQTEHTAPTEAQDGQVSTDRPDTQWCCVWRLTNGLACLFDYCSLDARSLREDWEAITVILEECIFALPFSDTKIGINHKGIRPNIRNGMLTDCDETALLTVY